MHAEFHHAVVTEEREFVCAGCGCRRTALVTGIGEGAASSLNAAETGPRRAREAALQDVGDTLALAACPACGARAPSAARRWWWRHAGVPALVLLPIIGGCAFGPYLFDLDMSEHDRQLTVGVVLGVFAFAMALVALPIRSKWRSASARVQWK